MTVKQTEAFQTIRKRTDKLEDDKKALILRGTQAYADLPDRRGRGVKDKSEKTEACEILGVTKQTMENRVRNLLGGPKKRVKTENRAVKSKTEKKAGSKKTSEATTKEPSKKKAAPKKKKTSSVDTGGSGSKIDPQFDD